MERANYDKSIENLRKQDGFIADIIEEGIAMMEDTVFLRELSEDEKMIAFSSYLTGILLGNIEAKIEIAESSAPSLN